MPATLFSHVENDATGRFSGNIMLREMRDFNWSSSPAGPIDAWPDALKHASRMMLLSSAPITVLIGAQGIVAYNDATRAIFGAHYVRSLGKPVAEVLPESAEFYRNALDASLQGYPSSFRDQPLRLYRGGGWRTAWFDLEFTPIADEDGVIHGALLISSETTERVRALRDLQRSRERLDLALNAGGIVGTWEFDISTDIVTADERFSRLFGVDPQAAHKGLAKSAFIAAIHPEDRRRVLADIQHSIDSGADYRCRYRVVDGSGTIRWIVASGCTMRDKMGKVTRFPGVAVDITEQVEITMALAESELRFSTLAETLPQIVWSADGAGRHDYFNQRWHEFTGIPAGPVDPDAWMRLVHPHDWASVSEAWNHSRTTGKPYDIDYRFLHSSGEHRWLRVMALPLRNADGKITRWCGTATDIHLVKLLDSERELVSRELGHRIKNIFAVTQGLIALTLRENLDTPTFAKTLRGRLTALDRAHDCIIPGASDAIAQQTENSLQNLVRRLLAPYDAGGERRLVIEGDDVFVDTGATSLALIFHELATNAAKYGALSTADGHIRLESKCVGDTLRLVWTEIGGLDAQPPSKTNGFGSKLLTLVIEGQMRGQLSRVSTPNGLQIRIALPLDSLAKRNTPISPR